MNHLAIFGASGHGKVVADTAEQSGAWNKISFFDDRWPNYKSNGKWDVIGDYSILLDCIYDFQGVIIAIGDNQIREKKQLSIIGNHKDILVSVIHPTAYVSPNSRLGVGVVVFANAVINTDTSIGDGCIVNTGATVDHDCRIFNFVHISPGANVAGGVKIKERSWVGIGASIIQEINIDSDVVIGAGSTVINNIGKSTKVAGVPAKSINNHIN